MALRAGASRDRDAVWLDGPVDINPRATFNEAVVLVVDFVGCVVEKALAAAECREVAHVDHHRRLCGRFHVPACSAVLRGLGSMLT